MEHQWFYSGACSSTVVKSPYNLIVLVWHTCKTQTIKKLKLPCFCILAKCPEEEDLLGDLDELYLTKERKYCEMKKT